MDYEIEKKPAPNRQEVEVLGETYEKGKPDDETVGKWQNKIGSRQDILKYVQISERYWFDKESYGSEKRKTPA